MLCCAFIHWNANENVSLKSILTHDNTSFQYNAIIKYSPHPGNIFVLEDGSIGLIDFGQVKQISGRARETLAKVMVALDERESDTNPADLEIIGKLALELGVEFNDDARPEGPPAVGMFFGQLASQNVVLDNLKQLFIFLL